MEMELIEKIDTKTENVVASVSAKTTKKELGQNNNVYFLGAGVSAPLGIPTFQPFMQKVEETCNKSQDEEIKKTFETVLELWKDRFDDSIIEEYYSYVEMLGMVEEFAVFYAS